MSFRDDLLSLRDGRLDFDGFGRRHAARFRRWAGYFYNRWPQSILDLEDLIQEGLIEAWRAIDEWDPDKTADPVRFVEFRVGSRITTELQRVLGWPRKATARRKGKDPIRPLSTAVPGVELEVGRKLVEDGSSVTRLLEVGEIVEKVPDDLTREIATGVAMGMSLEIVAGRLYEDPDRRLAYEFDSFDEAVRKVRRVARRVAKRGTEAVAT